MNVTSASPAEAHAPRRTLVWDAPVRVFHWLMVLSFAGAWISAESERFRLLHVTLGYTMAALVAFRLLWGVVGTRHARFASFVRGPAAVAGYLKSLLRGTPPSHVGHNPAGALAIVVMLALTIGVTALGWAGFNEIGGEWIKDTHEAAASLMLAVVGVHVAGVALYSVMHRENLVRAMVTGTKAVSAGDGIRSAWRGLAAIMVVSVLGFWWQQWQSAPAAGADVAQRSAHTPGGKQAHKVDDGDDD